ncbi:DUF2852 domain-containing protein [Rhodoblastus sp.]|uniref:DUF2852 domain-containing protein n=1 Tax=Rhodoblastus sp. TaxID=1962975 RepID=UPI0035B23BBF
MICSRHADGRSSRHGSHGAPWRWRPIELAAMILGFVFFWPIGLAILGWKFFQAKTRYAGDFGQFAQEKWGGFEKRCGLGGMSRDFGGGWRSSGNSAFDDWRKAELERLEEERRKIYEAEKAFYDYQEALRRSKDREEFERFMASRAASAPPENPAS